MPCPGPFNFSHSVDYIYEFCPLPDPDVGPSIFVCDVEHTSFHFGLCGRKFVLCLFGQCPGLCTICHIWQHTGVVHLSLQADGKVAFEDIPVFGVCRPACYYSSLYLFVLVLFLEAVVLSQEHVAWDIFYQHIVHVYRGVIYSHHLETTLFGNIQFNSIYSSNLDCPRKFRLRPLWWFRKISGFYSCRPRHCPINASSFVCLQHRRHTGGDVYPTDTSQ